MAILETRPSQSQSNVQVDPFDRWVAPDGTTIAEFRRLADHFLVRFPGEIDFAIDHDCQTVRAFPVPTADNAIAGRLFRNAIEPLIGNYLGGLFLHGSAALIDGRAVAFVGQSRSGKTTLAGAFAKIGHPFLTEDVIDLEVSGAGGSYTLKPKPFALRLFPDSARFLVGSEVESRRDQSKQAYDDLSLQSSDLPSELSAICILGDDHKSELALRPLEPARALTALLPHSFILDVEDKQRMKRHFERLAALAECVAVYRLDYPRVYSALPEVCDMISHVIAGDRKHEPE